MSKKKFCYNDLDEGHRVCCRTNMLGDEVCMAEESYIPKEDLSWKIYLMGLLAGVFLLSILPWLLISNGVL